MGPTRLDVYYVLTDSFGSSTQKWIKGSNDLIWKTSGFVMEWSV